jgi:hypothetical protein
MFPQATMTISLGQQTRPDSREDFGAGFDLQLGESAKLDQQMRYELLR